MATAPPALAQMMARQLISKLAGGGAGVAAGGPGGPPSAGGPPIPPSAAGPLPPGAGPAAGGPTAPPPGLQLSQQLAELQNADPDATSKALTSMKGMAVSLYTRTAFAMPGVTRNLMQVIKYLDNSIQEAEKAAATTAAATPIANNAAIPNPVGQQGLSSVQGLQSQPGS